MVYVLMAEGFEEIEALTVTDILRRAGIKTELVSISGSKTITGAHGIKVTADINVEEITDDYDVIFLPGGYPGYVNLENSIPAKRIIADANDNNKIIAAICAAPSILGKMNLLVGKNACCFPSFENELIGANVMFDDVVCSGNIITSRGAGTAHKLGFKLVETLKGVDTAKQLAETMVY